MCVQQNPSNKETIGTTHGVQSMEVSVFQGFLFKFLVDMVMHTHMIWPHFCSWSSGLLCVCEKALKALLVTSTIDILVKKNTV